MLRDAFFELMLPPSTAVVVVSRADDFGAIFITIRSTHKGLSLLYPVGIRLRKNRDTQGAVKLDICYDLPQDDTEDICMMAKSSSSDKPMEDRPAPCIPKTIFSPGFHLPKDVCGGVVDKGDFTIAFGGREQSGYGEHVIEDSKIGTFNFCPPIETQQNSVDNGA